MIQEYLETINSIIGEKIDSIIYGFDDSNNVVRLEIVLDDGKQLVIQPAHFNYGSQYLDLEVIT